MSILLFPALFSACVAVNDVETDLVPPASGEPLGVRAGMLPSGTLEVRGKPSDPVDRSDLVERTAVLCEAAIGAGLAEDVHPYAEWDDVDVVIEVQERRRHDQMSTLVTVFTVLPPFWGLWLPYRSRQEREYVLHVYGPGSHLGSHRVTGEVAGWTWFIFTPDFDSVAADEPFLRTLAHEVAARASVYQEVELRDDHDHMWYVRYARDRGLLFQRDAVLDGTPGYQVPAWFDVPLTLPWFHDTTAHEVMLLQQRQRAIGDRLDEARARCTLCGREEDARFLFCSLDGMPLDHELMGGEP